MLSFSSPEFLAHAVGCRFESCHRLLFFYLYSVSTKKKFSHSLYLSSWLHSCHTMVKSAVLPKTTILCTSITVITLWMEENQTFGFGIAMNKNGWWWKGKCVIFISLLVCGGVADILAKKGQLFCSSFAVTFGTKKCRFLNGLSFLTPFMFKTPFLLISSVLLQINYAHILLSMFSSCMFFNTGY